MSSTHLAQPRFVRPVVYYGKVNCDTDKRRSGLRERRRTFRVRYDFMKMNTLRDKQPESMADRDDDVESLDPYPMQIRPSHPLSVPLTVVSFVFRDCQACVWESLYVLSAHHPK